MQLFFNCGDWVEATLVAAVKRLTEMQSGIFWTISYVVLLALMYLFHSPFRAQVNTRTDWYAQLTKGLQIWLGVVLLCFHVGPHLVALRSTSPDLTDTSTVVRRMRVEDTVASIFLPSFCFNTFLFLLLHKQKRQMKVSFTYGPSLTLIIINSVLLAMFVTMHYTVCEELFSKMVPAVEASSRTPSTRMASSAIERSSDLICPSSVSEHPFACIAFLNAISITFVAVDAMYKERWGNGNPSRGILWAELYAMKPKIQQSALLPSANEDLSAPLVYHWWRTLRPNKVHEDLVARFRLRSSDPRLKEYSPRTIHVNQRHGLPISRVTNNTAGWRDSHDELAATADRHVSQPTNRPGMVPWFSAFIFSTTWQAVARLALSFLTFDVRLLQHQATPKIFHLHFAPSLKELPSLSVPEEMEEADKNRKYGSSTSAEEAGAATSPTKRKSKSPAEDPVDVWFDWIADVGDGFNPTYAMARLLAQPELHLRRCTPDVRPTGFAKWTTTGYVTPAQAPSPHSLASDSAFPQQLPRGSFVVIGGDLAYPTPDDDTFTTRLFVPYRDALSDNVTLKGLYRSAKAQVIVPDRTDADVAHVHLLDAATVAAMATGKTSDKVSAEAALRSTPLLFAMPGNHDWFDGLATYMKYIVERSWLGGWLMPQKSSFFVLRLPYNWFMLCGDTGNTQDIDAAQRNYFLDVIEKYMDAESCVILAAHEPGWIYDSMLQGDELTQPELAKVAEALGTRLRLRMAGDIHNYSRHVPVDITSEAPMLVVSGGGGAFMHGPRQTPVVSQLTGYTRACAFPAHNTLGTLLSRLLGFRVINWKFDLIIGVVCFLMVVSLLPQSIKDTNRGESRAQLRTLPDAAAVWAERTATYVFTLLSRGITSVLATLLFFAAFTAAGTEKKAAVWMRMLHASFWTSLTVVICCGMLAGLLCIMEYMLDNDLLVSADRHWGSAVEDQVRQTVDAMLNHTQELLGGAEKSFAAAQVRLMQHFFYKSALLDWAGIFLRFLDPLEMLAYLSEKVSSPEMGTFADSASRLEKLLYYLYFLFFYWILVTPLVSFIIGSYLLCSVTFFDCLYDATYSAFQIENFKNFMRFRIDGKTRELHAYVVAMRNVPKTWTWDEEYQEEIKSDAVKAAPPHLRQHPSRWNGRPSCTGAQQQKGGALTPSPEGNEDGAELLEYFVCVPHRSSSKSE